MRTCGIYGIDSNAASTERTVDGARYLIRPISAADADRERGFICGLSEASRYSRLMHAVREPSAAFIDQMVRVDFRHSMAFVAVVEAAAENFIGVARYAYNADGSGCEFAIVVADRWQSRGVGNRIAHRLIDYARAQGIPILRASISAANSRMVSFAHRLGFTTRFTPGESGLLSARLELAETSTPRPKDAESAK